MQRYFIREKNINFPYTEIIGNDMHHIKNVMRFKVGQVVILNTYSGLVYQAKILEITNKSIKLKIIDKVESKFKPVNLDIGLSLIKKDKFELALKKITELGVKGIIPLETEYSIIKISDYQKKLERFKAICKESSEQTQRNTLPDIYDFKKITDLDLKTYDFLFFGYVKEQNIQLNSCIDNLDLSKKVLFLIGPEGGFSDQEADYLLEKGFVAVALGNTILRAETAAIYVASVFRFMMGENR
ncbi:MAG: 16S rRNA (uracil(1498)-N(3))-methyltransferase [Candidatus Izimaplasma sp.]|nr:16S rRNA (uracil(1498)-N(3))-methyltransferase [Candidatus Izimaplasma bacterium]